MTQPTRTTPAEQRWAWLKKLNASLSAWAATLSWWRMALLGLIVLIASSWIADHLQLQHQTRSHVAKTTAVKNTAGGDNTARPCKNKTIVIGGKPAVVISEAGCVAEPSVEAASAASAPEVPIRIELPRDGDAAKVLNEDSDTPDEQFTVSSQKTLGGYIGDLVSVVLIIFFAYLAAAKIIVRKTAESDAKVQRANDSAEREAMQRQLVQARLKLLQAQVEPHFLFNTLAAVDYLIETDPKRASDMQKLLIAYLRAALPQMREESSTLGRELALIQPYLELLKLRIEDRMSYEIQVPSGLASTVFPPMVLQTLVENAIKHGIEPKPEGGKVTVRAEVIDGLLQVQVIDTGVGLGKGNICTTQTQGAGLGLDNIRNRLALLYPGTGHLELRAGDPCGTVATLTIPYQSEKFKPK